MGFYKLAFDILRIITVGIYLCWKIHLQLTVDSWMKHISIYERRACVCVYSCAVGWFHTMWQSDAGSIHYSLC